MTYRIRCGVCGMFDTLTPDQTGLGNTCTSCAEWAGKVFESCSSYVPVSDVSGAFRLRRVGRRGSREEREMLHDADLSDAYSESAKYPWRLEPWLKRAYGSLIPYEVWIADGNDEEGWGFVTIAYWSGSRWEDGGGRPFRDRVLASRQFDPRPPAYSESRELVDGLVKAWIESRGDVSHG